MPAPHEARSLRILGATVKARRSGLYAEADGWLGGVWSKGRISDHNPDPRTGVVRARDVDVEGMVAQVVVASAMLHPATRYVIFDGRIYRDADRYRPRIYEGANQHTGYVHVSILRESTAENSQAPWELIMGFDWPELALGSIRKDVRALQALLNAWGASLVVDGLFGSATAVALKAFQSQRQLLVDGRAGPQTQAALAQSVPDHQILEPATTD